MSEETNTMDAAGPDPQAERKAERESLLAAIADSERTAPSENPQESEDLASDKPVEDGRQEVAAKTDGEPEPEAKSDGEGDADVGSNDGNPREKKAKDRLNKHWRDFNDAKAEFQQEKENFEAEKARQLAELQEKRDEGKYSAEDYREIASQFREEGNEALADMADEKAAAAERTAVESRAREEQDKIQSEWKSNLDRMIDENPDLNDKESELFRGVEQIMQDRKVLGAYPEGIVDAVEFVKTKLAAGAADSLRQKNEELQSQLNELNQKTEIGGSPTSGGPSEPKGFDDMSQGQRREALLGALREADAQGVQVF